MKSIVFYAYLRNLSIAPRQKITKDNFTYVSSKGGWGGTNEGL